MNYLKTTVLMAGLTGLLIVIGQMIGGTGGAVIAFGIAIVMNFISYWFSDKIVLRMYRAEEIGPEDRTGLYGMVERLARQANLPMPKVYIIPNDTPNAFATGRNPKHAAVAATEGILRILNEEELEGVMAHELAHVRNRDILISSIAATIAGAITMIANMAQWAAMFGGFNRSNDEEHQGGGVIGLLAMAIIAPLAAMIIQMAISRSREYAADRTGSGICGKPLSLASALRRLERGVERLPMNASPATAHLFIVNPLRGGGLATLFSTHPSMDDRVERLEALARQMGR
ncbi:MAG: zinc metalloprotease HtpX [candidate division Zixibacteria bacterium]|nr:zinc metalloprotease HtpX [candidate division Zixibacteria bacterium]